MTEYDYSPEGYQRYLDTQQRISRWVANTNAHASEFRSPFGARSDVSSSPATSPRPKSQRSSNTNRGLEMRGRRNSISTATLRQSVSGGSNVGSYSTQRSPAYAPQIRHSYPYPSMPQANPAFHSQAAVIPGGTLYAVPSSSHRRSQSLSSRPPPSQSQTYSRTHHRHGSHSHGLDPPKRSATLPAAAYVVTSPQQTTAVSHRTHRTHSSHRTSPHSHRSSSHHHHGHGHGHGHHHSSSRSNSTQVPVYSPGAVAIVDNRAYAPNPGGYVIVPPKNRKMSVIYT